MWSNLYGGKKSYLSLFGYVLFPMNNSVILFSSKFGGKKSGVKGRGKKWGVKSRDSASGSANKYFLL